MAGPIDYREMLRIELVVRRIRNPKYSLRAFARDCKISPSRFSEVLRMKNNLYLKSGTKIAGYLGLSSQVAKHFMDSIAYELNRSDSRTSHQKLRSSQSDVDSNKANLASTQDSTIATWLQAALKEIVLHKNFFLCEKWIADMDVFSEGEFLPNLFHRKRNDH